MLTTLLLLFIPIFIYLVYWHRCVLLCVCPSVHLFGVCTNILWTSRFFVTKLVMVVHHHEAVCQAPWLVCYLQIKVTELIHLKKRRLFLYIYLRAFNPFATKLSVMVQHHKPKCLSKRLICRVQGQQKLKISVDISRRYTLNRYTFCNQPLYGGALS